MGRDEQHPLNEGDGEWEFPSGKELGPLLKNRREEMGLTCVQISEQIKVRPRYLEALENEDWNRLPAPTFVKGFIRSYARALGLSEEGLVSLYQEIVPHREHPLSTKSIQPTTRRRKAPFYLIVVLALLVGALSVYHWMETPGSKHTGQEDWAQNNATHPGDNDADDVTKVADIPSEITKSGPDEATPEPMRLETDKGLRQGRTVPTEDSTANGGGDTSIEVPLKTAEGPSPEPTEDPSRTETTAEDTTSVLNSTREPSRNADRPALKLKATVKERTWIRVTIDDKKPKEYILDPGSAPEWGADSIFDLLIGNAGGIDLEYNGKKMQNLGKQGQVIRLKLPLNE